LDTHEFKGSNGTLIVQPTKVILKYGKFLGSGKGEKEIRIKSITGMQIKKPGLMAGYIQFAFSGGKEQNGRSVLDATKDENTIMCNSKSQYEGFLTAKELIEKYQDELDKGTSSTTTVLNEVSAADEIKKLAELRDSGILTEEEFSAKKKQLLGI
jgi:Short C-terminal domain